MGFCASLIPWCRHLWQMSILVGVDGAAMGALDTLGNIAVLSRLKNYHRHNNTNKTIEKFITHII